MHRHWCHRWVGGGVALCCSDGSVLHGDSCGVLYTPREARDTSALLVLRATCTADLTTIPGYLQSSAAGLWTRGFRATSWHACSVLPHSRRRLCYKGSIMYRWDPAWRAAAAAHPSPLPACLCDGGAVLACFADECYSGLRLPRASHAHSPHPCSRSSSTASRSAFSHLSKT